VFDIFDCFSKLIRGALTPYLSYKDSHYVVAATALEPRLAYTAIVEQATADAESFLGVPAIATYATLTFVKFQTLGEAIGAGCPFNSSD